MGLIVLVTLIAVVIASRFGRVDNPGSVPLVSPSVPTETTTSVRSTAVTLQNQLRTALNQESWPGTVGTSLANMTDCYNVYPTIGDHCTFGTRGKPLIVVYGDMFALNLLPTLDAAAGKDYSIKGLVTLNCPITGLKLTSGSGTDCPARGQRALTWATEHHPALVIVAQNPQWMLSMDQSQGASGTVTQWIASENAFHKEWSAVGGTMAFTSGSLPNNDSSDCRLRSKTPAECIASTPTYFNDLAAAQQKNTTLSYLDIADWFCVYGQCPAFSDGKSILDGWWLTKEYATEPAVVADLRAQLTGLTKHS